MAVQNNLGRNEFVYNATSEPYKAKQEKLDFTQIQARENQRVAEQAARESQLAKAYDTGLYEVFSSDIRRDLDALTKDVQEGRLDPKSLDYQRRFQGVAGKTARYKQSSDTINAMREAYNKNPEKWSWTSPTGAIYTGAEGFTAWEQSLHTPSPEGRTEQEILMGVTEQGRSFGQTMDVKEETLQLSADNLAKGVLQKKIEKAQEAARINGTEFFNIENTIKFDDKDLDDARKAWITENTPQLDYLFGTYQANREKRGEFFANQEEADAAFKRFTEEQARLRLPDEIITSSIEKGTSAASDALSRARANKINKELTVELAPVSYGVTSEIMNKDNLDESYRKSMEASGYSKEEIDKALETRKYLSSSLSGNVNILTPQVKMTIATEKGEMLVSDLVYEPETGDFYMFGIVPKKGSKTIKKDEYEYAETEDGKAVRVGAGSETDFAATQTESIKIKGDKEKAISAYMKTGMSREQAKEQVNLLMNNPDEAVKEAEETPKTNSGGKADVTEEEYNKLKSGDVYYYNGEKYIKE